MIQGILWDNDGVLVDTERLFYAVNRDLLSEHAIALSEQQFFDWYLADNCGAWHLLEARGVSAAQIDALRDERNRRYCHYLAGAGELAIAHMAALLARCAARLRMGIVTSASRAHFDIIHARADFTRHVEFVLTDSDYTHSKPSPEPYLLGLQRLGLAPEQCLVVEDSPRGLQAAMAAGIACIVVRNAMTRHHRFDGAHRVVDTVEQLEVAIKALL